MRDDLISRSALKEAIDPIKQTGYVTNNEPLFEYVELPDLIKAIDNASAVCNDNYSMGYQDGVKKVLSERPHGHWIKTISENGITSAARCSECGFGDNRYMLFRYCPNCGADMRGGRE